MFILFCVLQGLVQAFALGCIVWLFATQSGIPETSSYPLIDFSTKTRFLNASQTTGELPAGYDPTDDLTAADGSRSVRKLLKGRRTVIFKGQKT